MPQRGPAGQAFLAVDRNVTLSEFFVPLMAALGRPVAPPPREPIRSRCRTGKIHTILGYRPQQTFEHTLTQLLALAGRQGGSRPGGRES